MSSKRIAVDDEHTSASTSITTFHDLPWELVDALTDLAPLLAFTTRAHSRLLTEERRYQLLIDNGGSIVIDNCLIKWKWNDMDHRRNGPACVMCNLDASKNAVKLWMIKGKRHREDGPAIEWADGDREWWVNGERHRLDKPAIERSNGDVEWWKDGLRHCIDRPAIDYAGRKEWWCNGRRHRVDGPACQERTGYCEWWLNDKRHRIGGPAKYMSVGVIGHWQEWWVDGKLHRVDGPAVDYPSHQEWWIDGVQIDPETGKPYQDEQIPARCTNL